jgi:hypothetical protein
MNPILSPRRAVVPFLAAGALFLVPGAAQAASADPMLVDGNPSCADLGYPHELKFDPPAPGSKSADGVTVEMSLGADQYGTLVDWTSSAPIDAVIVKGGPNALSYVYAGSSSGDAGLHTPFNGPDKYYGLSHVNFCWDDQTPPPDDKTPPPGDDTPPPPGDKTPPPGDTPPAPPADQTPPAGQQPPAATPPAVPAAGVLGEQVRSGTSRLRGPSGCAGRTVKATVSGRAIKSVVFALDGKRVKRTSGAGSYSVRSATLSAGIHRIKAKVTFKAARMRSRTHVLTFHRCAAKQVAPRFAG